MLKLQGWTDQKIEQIIGNLLRAGVLLAAVVVLTGATLYLHEYAHSRVHYHSFRGEPVELRSVGAIAKDAWELHGRGIIQLGLLLLILTPIARVAFSAVAFALEGDLLYVFVTLFVLGVLLYSLIGSR